jgi:deoxyribodipyrimidine photolyase-related protein
VPTFLIEESLFFREFNFHKQKIFFHRLCMKKYEKHCKNFISELFYIESNDDNSNIVELITNLKLKGLKKINLVEFDDNWLKKRLDSVCEEITLNFAETPQFLNSYDENSVFFKKDKLKFFQTSFYKSQRKRLDILMINDKPFGGKWTYDDENRKKYPAKKIPPNIKFPETSNSSFYHDSVKYVNENFKDNIGKLNENFIYPTDFNEAKVWFENFLKERFLEFGDYEDAIVKEFSILNHSLISPLLNSGLLTPKYVVERILNFAEQKNIPINSNEGIIRQIIGWREFIRGIYVAKGSYERTRNFWNFKKEMPQSFYTGNTGIEPVDDCIKKVLNTGYLHHIERLMVIGNFMFLCEIKPDAVYSWFMELFIDSYDWVMVPNVYGMSQYADGGLMSTKPYISSSNYIMKMSNYKKSDWQQIWDSLYWRFISNNADFFKSNPRLSMMVITLNRMNKEKLNNYHKIANDFLNNLK